jgi:S1-C subfamily serine protease
MSEKGRLTVVLTTVALALALTVPAAPKGLALDENTLENVSKKVFASVVKVESRNGFTKVATGVVIDKDGRIVTTALISAKDEKITVTSSEGRRSQAKFLGFDPETHLALIQSNEKNWTPIGFGKAEGLVPGSWIGLISISPENTPSVAQGIVSSIAPDRLRLNIWVTRGASGSPVVNKDGQMVGLLRGIYSEAQDLVFEFREREVVGSGYVFGQADAPSSGMALAIPVDIVTNVAAEIREKGKVSRGWVGVSIAENEKGQIEVGEVEKESPAELAKLEEGDILLAIDGKKITSAQAFVSEIRNRKPGQDIKLEVERKGKTSEVKLKLGEYPEAEARRELAFRFPRLFPDRPVTPERPEQTPRPEAAPKGKYEIFTVPKMLKTWPAWEKRKYIGVTLEPMTKQLLEFFGVKEESGLLVNQLTKGAPAEKAGLKVGDVIVRADGKKLASTSDLSGLIQDKKKGDKVKIDLVRDKKPISLEVEVEEEENPSFSWAFPESREVWGDAAKELERQFQRSRDIYEKSTQESKEKLKKLTEEMTLKSKDYFEKSQELYKKSLDKAKKGWESIYQKNRVYYRA